MNAKLILYPLRFAVLAALVLWLVCLLGCTVKRSSAQDPIKEDDPGTKDEPNTEHRRWATVNYDGHLYTVRYCDNGASIVHSPNCFCLTNKVVEAR